MRTIDTEIKINTSAAIVWKVLTDFEAYPVWNDFLVHISGNPVRGQKLEVHIQTKRGIQKVYPEVVRAEQDHQFEWIGTLPLGVFKGHHCFEIIPEGPLQVRFVHKEHFSGWLSGPILNMIGAQTKTGFQSMNLLLKKRAEDLNGSL